jgi:DNA-binding response OmpR family regulator
VRPPRALIVEDAADIATALTRMLQHWGWAVVVVDTVAAGLTALAIPFDLVVLDMWLPDGDGTEVLRKVRGEALGCRVLVSTAHGASGALDAANRLAPDAVMPKPIKYEDFRAFVMRCRDEAAGKDGPP